MSNKQKYFVQKLMDITPKIQNQYFYSISDYDITLFKGLPILYVNIRTLNNKFNEVQSILQQTNRNIDIVVMTKTWLYTDCKKYFDTYNSFLNQRVLNGEEVLQYLLGMYLEERILYIDRGNFQISTAYRCSHTGVQVFLDKLDFVLQKYNGNFFLFNEINIDLLGTDRAKVDYTNVVQSNNMKINKIDISMPTRPDTGTIIDRVVRDPKK